MDVLPLLLNELMDDVMRSKGRGLVLKLDFEKVYKKVGWSFLGKV